MHWSIRYRLFVPLGLLLLGVVGVSLWSALSAAGQAEERIARQVRSVTHTLAGANIALTPRILEQMKGLSGADYLLVDADGSRISTLSDPDSDLPANVLHQPIDEGDSDPLGLPVQLDGRHYRCRRLPQRAGGNLYILYPETSLNQAIGDAVRPFIIFGLMGGGAALALMYFIGQRLVGRIRDLDRRTRLIAGGDFSPMPLPRPHDELRELARSVNEMAERLSQFQDTIRTTEQARLLGQLSSGLAHQLRNSVTGAKLALQLHLSETSPTESEAIDVALRQLNLMEANLRRFIDLGRSDRQPGRHCALANLIDEVISLLRPQARHAGIKLNWQRPERSTIVEGDAAQLRDALQNIIGNALEACGSKGSVDIAVTFSDRSPETISVTIIDTGPGPPTAIAERLFEPFVTGKPEGIGLGLAVARHAVEMHGGNIIWWRNRERTHFQIVLPAPRQSEPEA